MSTSRREVRCPLCREQIAIHPSPPTLPPLPIPPVYMGEGTHFAIIVDEQEERALDSATRILRTLTMLVPATLLFVVLGILAAGHSG